MPIDAADDLGYTLLHTAAVNDKVSLARSALALGIDGSKRCLSGSTALDYAVELGAEGVAEQFRKVGITYRPAEKAKSDIYREFLPAINSQTLEELEFFSHEVSILGTYPASPFRRTMA